MNNNEHGHGEIIIIKRGNEEEEGHHGGAWKIAFADFMTAMMALFLVLWLINAANEETKRAVASYFNPVKLVDRNRSSKGINDQNGGPTTAPETGTKEKNPEDKTAAPTGEQKPQESKPTSEETFFSDPNQQLDAIEQAALAAQSQENAAVAVPATRPDPSLDNFADPFGPDFWDKAQAKQDEQKPESQAEISQNQQPPADAKGVPATDKPAPVTETQDAEKVAAIGPQEKLEQPAEVPNAEAGKAAEKAALAKQLRANVALALEGKVKDAQDLAKSIEIKTTDEGILVSVTDTLGHPMFEIGSAVPAARLAFAVDAIAKSLASETGAIHVFGHTDAREYRNVADGNWRLSTDRAKATYFMLMHGGLQDSRVVEIAGFADRKLRAPDDPLADENRRIEILLETK